MSKQVILLAALGILAGSCGGVPRFGAPDPVTADGDRILSLWQGSVLTALAVGALVWGLIAWTVLAYRRRRGADGLPSQRAPTCRSRSSTP